MGGMELPPFMQMMGGQETCLRGSTLRPTKDDGGET
jgi:hypothetical protein